MAFVKMDEMASEKIAEVEVHVKRNEEVVQIVVVVCVASSVDEASTNGFDVRIVADTCAAAGADAEALPYMSVVVERVDNSPAVGMDHEKALAAE